MTMTYRIKAAMAYDDVISLAVTLQVKNISLSDEDALDEAMLLFAADLKRRDPKQTDKQAIEKAVDMFLISKAAAIGNA